MDAADAVDAVDAAVQQLYAGTRADFVATRTRLVKDARAAGDRAAATAIGALRKPTVAAWLVNQVVRNHPEAYAEACAVGTALRTAHHDLDGAALRSLSLRRNDILHTLVTLAADLTPEGELPTGTADQIRATFDAAVRDEATARTVQAARLATTLEDAEVWPFGADEFAAPDATTPSPVRKTPAPPPTPAPAPKRSARLTDRAAPGTRRPDPGARLAARRRAAAAADAEERAHRTLARAEEAAVAADAEVRRLADRLAAAEDAAATAHTAVAQARSALDDASTESAAAHRALTAYDTP